MAKTVTQEIDPDILTRLRNGLCAVKCRVMNAMSGCDCAIAADEIERLRAVREAATPFADHDWYDAELEDDNCKLTKHSGPITVGHWRALGRALNETR